MWFVAIGVIFIVLKVGEWTPLALWPWWGVLSPFGLAVVWWFYADVSGLTKRRAMERDETRVANRRQRHLENMGLDLVGKRRKKR